MVKAVVGEESRLQLAEDRLSHSAIPSEVGLVIGKISSSSDRGLVFDLVPTPTNDAGEPACSLVESVRDDKKKGSKSKSQSDSSSLFIDKDWVAEHARQVSRMLLGGIKVLGIYIWISEGSFKNSTIILCQTVKGVAEAAPLLETDWDERLLIHISYSPRRWTCRNCAVASNISSSSLRPCDFKMGRVLASLQTFRCTYAFDLRLPICHESGSNVRKLADILRHGISSHAKELKGAKAIIDGNLVVDEEESCVSDGLHEVQFLLPFMKDLFVEACSQKEVVGIVVFSGSVCSFAYLNSKEPLSQALADLKGDIIESLLSRLDICCDEADGESSLTVNGGKEVGDELTTGEPFLQLNLHSLRKQCSLSFPRRVFVPWLAGTYICDYLQPSETIEVLKDHCVELMSMEAPTDSSTILEPEVEPLALSTKSFWNAVAPFSSTSTSSQDVSTSKESGTVTSNGNDGKSTKSADFNIKAAVLVLIFAILVGLVLYMVRAL
ncbi:protein odr-4 homolog [Camellia sinensis]|uniref:protein odr-4 homolog n=1 Tax=Camellia sinensis TaxID=4442 RepID=UPI001035B47F|nr:protein odr-4 homolog [Camellia sinensis]